MSKREEPPPKSESPAGTGLSIDSLDTINNGDVITREGESQFPGAAIDLYQTSGISPPHSGYGATSEEWNHFSIILGLTEDMLPVVSNPNATISPNSKLKVLGKTPSRYYANKQVGGIKDWTQHQASAQDISRWAEEPDYSICLITRTVRALDCDIDDPQLAKAIYAEIARYLHTQLPTRRRGGAPRFVLAFSMPGEFGKRTIRTDGGIIEFLATGQQFVVAGQHPSGVRYEWDGGLPSHVPTLTPEQFEKLWQHLIDSFGNGETISTKHERPSRREKLSAAILSDPRAQYLLTSDAFISAEGDGRIHIVCPFRAEHTSDSSDSSTTYLPRRTGGYESGHFSCLHAHCADRTDAEFNEALGIPSPDLDDFDIIEPETTAQPKKERYAITNITQFENIKPPEWLIKRFLQRSALGFIYGEPGSGKTFFTIDLGLAVAGVAGKWRDRKTTPGRVVYIAAEDSGGVIQRTRAYLLHNAVHAGGYNFGLISDPPNFLKGEDVSAVNKKIQEFGGADLIIIDTLARVTAGANENSGEDMGKALSYCDALRRATGATMLIVHHSGKDSSRGLRGWSGMLGAADAVFEVSRAGEDREVQVIKLKNSQDGERFGFKLLPVWVGEDEDGEDIVSCVVEHTPAKGKTIKRRKLGPIEKTVLDALSDISADGAVTQSALIQAAVNKIVHDDSSGKRDKRKEHVIRAMQALINVDAIEMLPDSKKLQLAGE